MKLLLAADGERDDISLPPILTTVLERQVDCEFVSWVHLHRAGSGRGYDKKLNFAVGQARSRGLDGLVAVVDRDKDRAGHRAAALRSTRDSTCRQAIIFPTALGVADPHVDVWLLDDPVAVRQGLGLEPNAEVISVHRIKYPKDELNRLIDSQGLDRMDTLKAIASKLQPQRCNHAKQTGFEAFAEDCRSEFDNLPA